MGYLTSFTQESKYLNKTKQTNKQTKNPQPSGGKQMKARAHY